ncbi:MAG: ADP-ribosylglycohydrolase family protein [Hyphomicrobiales bacterium]
MLGSIAGDIIGSPYEGQPITIKRFPLFTAHSRFTDDTVLTVATAWALLHGTGYAHAYRKFGQAYPHRGYGGSFRRWLFHQDMGPYNSYGNGSAMRVSPVGFACASVEDVLDEAGRSAEVTHNHPEGIKGAQAVALAVFLARTGWSKADIKRESMGRFGYNLDRRLDDIRKEYGFDVTCQGSVPEAIIAFLESESVEDAIRNAISLGGDADTQACIAGGIAEAFYGGVPEAITAEVRKRLPREFLAVIDAFYQKHGSRSH